MGNSKESIIRKFFPLFPPVCEEHANPIEIGAIDKCSDQDLVAKAVCMYKG